MGSWGNGEKQSMLVGKMVFSAKTWPIGMPDSLSSSQLCNPVYCVESDVKTKSVNH